MAFFGLLRLFAANQYKCLSMNHLHTKLSFPAKAQSSLIKPNQVIFLAAAISSFGPVRQAWQGKYPLIFAL